MKKTIIIALLALIAVAGQAKVYKTIRSPKSMGCMNVYAGELKAREVVFADTATTVYFTIEYGPGRNFRFVKDGYLIDEDGNRYSLRSAEGITLDKWITSPENGLTDFTMHFDPMPKKVKMFDFVEGDFSDAFMLLGIHDGKMKVKAPTIQELSKANPYIVPSDWIKTDDITIRGRIEGYDAETFGFTSMESYCYNVFLKEGGVRVLDIAPDGTFEKTFRIGYPVMTSFFAQKSKVDFDEIPFFARPGETIDITIKKNDEGKYECFYNNGSSKDVERWLKSNLNESGLLSPLGRFNGTFSDAKLKAEEVWKNLMYRLNMVSKRNLFTPLEMQLALAAIQSKFACAYMDYVMHRENELDKWEKDEQGNWTHEIKDSVEWEKLFDVKNYTPLHRVDFDNPLMLAEDGYYFTVNRIEYARPATRFFISDVGEDAEKNELSRKSAILRDLMGDDKDNLTAQICVYNDMMGRFDSWRSADEPAGDSAETEDESLENMTMVDMKFPLYLERFTNPWVYQKAEEFYAQKMAQKDISSPLPSNNPAADLIRSLSAKYPGRTLIIDFWGMGCGPCRSAIESSKNKRAELAGRDDIKFVYIAGESTPGGSDAYKKYVSEWLDGEETVCVSNMEFRNIEEMFQFSGIPHYEIITPNCRRAREDYRPHGFHNIDFWLERMLPKLK